MSNEILNQVLAGGEFLISDVNPAHIFIPEEIDEDQRMMVQMVRDFIQKEVAPNESSLEKQGPLMERSAELGLLGAHIPQIYGGMELDSNTLTFILEEMGKGGGSFNTSFAAHTGIGMLPILYFGTEEQKQKYLPPMSDGSMKAAYCLTEPGSGSDALAAKTRADLSADGSHYVINGQKMWISNAGFADLFIVFAKINGEDFTGFIVDAKSQGISLGAEEAKLGIKGSSTRQVFFENVKVPADQILGERGKGHLIAFNSLNMGRFKLGNMCLGGCKLVIDNSVKYANDRYQFGVPISSFGAIKYKIAESAVRTFALESATYRVSEMMRDKKEALMSEDRSFADALRVAAEEYAIECSFIKIYGSEAIDYVVDEGIQIHGGNGFSEEFPLAQAYRDARINRIYEGTNEINRLLIVNMLLKRVMKGQLNMVDAAWDVQKELTKMPSFTTSSEPLAAEAKAVKHFKKMTLMVAGAAAKYQMDGKIDLKNEQEIIMNAADMLMETFVAESVLLRLQKLQQKSNDSDFEIKLSMLKTLLYDTQDRLAKYAKDALGSFATGDEKRIMMMGIQRFSTYNDLNVKDARRRIAEHMIEANGYTL